jgi:hypothetical protein
MTEKSKKFLIGSSELEDAFFLKQDKKLTEQLAAMKKMKETKANLKKVSGIENEAVLQKLIDLKIPPHIVASLSMIPLVEVAWADGTIGEKEHETILKAAGLNSDIDRELLKSWLTHKPEPVLLEAWTLYINGLCEKMNADEKKILKETLLFNAYKVANVEGGFLGVGSKLSKKEKEMLQKLEASFK